MFNKNKPCNPWRTLLQAFEKIFAVIFFGYWSIRSYNESRHGLIIALFVFVAVLYFKDAVLMLLKANAETTEFYRKAESEINSTMM